MNLTTREAQALALTDQVREELEEVGDDEHPFIYAEQGPNRYQSVTWFFPDDDGVRVQEDLDLGEVTVFYFDVDGKEQELTSGPVFDWAVNQYENA
jgi:hypothetical protein